VELSVTQAVAPQVVNAQAPAPQVQAVLTHTRPGAITTTWLLA